MRDHPYSPDLDHHALNALLNLQGPDGGLQLDADQAAIAAYFRNHVDPSTVTFESVDAQIDWLVAEGYYEAGLFAGHDRGFLRALWAQARARGFRFQSFLGAFKFHTGYALRTRDGRRYLERYEDRVVIVALTLARGDEALARRLVEEMLSGRFQPATPTFLNAGRVSRGELVSCFLLRLEDNMESIGRGLNSALQLSRRGGGVALMLSNLREAGAPIKGIANQSSGVVPVMKLLEDSFSYADQLGARQGAGAVYLHAHHPDILRFLDTRRENADEKIRIKTLSLGVVIPDVTFALAAQDAEMHLFSPHDVARVYGRPFSEVEIGAEYDAMVANPAIGKTTLRARRFFEILAEIQFESGYPYLVFEDTVNRANPIAGRVTMSNLCTEILQVAEASQLNEDLSYAHVGTDISCNLGSLNIARVMDGGDIGAAVETAVQALTAVSELSAIDAVPSIRRGNDEGHAIGLGQMNLHGFLAREALHYGSPAAIDFTSAYFAAVAYHALAASMRLARARGRAFAGFERSSYASGAYFERYVSRDWHPETPAAQALFARFGITLPDRADWRRLRAEVMEHGIYNRYLQAVPPTGSISYINHATASIHPIAARIEIRKEGRIGRVYYPAPHMTAANLCYYRDAYEIGPEAIIDTYAAATVHVDQGLSLTLFFPDTATTRDLNRAQIRAWRAGIKTLYYVRLRQAALAGTAVEGCLSCAL